MPESLIFLLKTIGIGLLAGFIIGFLFKKISKLAVVLIAILIILVVVFGHNEILNIDWLSLKEEGSGFINDFLGRYQGMAKVLLRNIPFMAGLIIGGIIGLNRG